MNYTNSGKKAADNIRILAAAMVEKAKSGHPGGAMGGADFMHVLYTDFLNFDPKDPKWINRDRFFLDPGHMSPMLYSTLALCNYYSMEELQQFRQWGSVTPGHPEVDFLRGVENTSGPLGQGHVMAVGAAIAAKFLQARFGDWMNHKIYAYISDGGIQEEISQGAGRIAGQLKLDNLIMFYDANEIQLSTKVKEVSCEDTAAKYDAWGWDVFEIDGHDHDEIRKTLKMAQKSTRPVLIIGETIMGKGALGPNFESFENLTSTHGQPLSAAGASFENTVSKMGGDPNNPFVIFPEVQEMYKKALDKKAKYAETKKKEQAEWEAANPELAAKLKAFYALDSSNLDFSKIEQKPDTATRASSSTVLSYLAQNMENMIVASADLANSDKTDGFLKYTKAFKARDFSGAFLQAGVSELTLAAIANGMALHGGVRVAIGTFFVFSDYMKPALRLSALMQTPVIYIWTHDSFRVGEDGPTHQPIEHEAQIRLMEELRNHAGKPSTLVLRPADAAECTVAWQMAIQNTDTPTALILSRQNLKDLEPVNANSTRREEAKQAERGAYVVYSSAAANKPDLTLVGNGSEVDTLVQVAKKLNAEKQLAVNVVSVPSIGLFMEQSEDYRSSVIPQSGKVMGLTSGLCSTLRPVIGSGKIFGHDTFGYSAPYKVLEEKFGYTIDAIYQNIVANL